MIGETDLKYYKLNDKMLREQHQCECEYEQYKLCVMQLQYLMSWNGQAAGMIQSHDPTFLEGFGFMAELTAAERLFSLPFKYTVYLLYCTVI
jgi:hypothetical protein